MFLETGAAAAGGQALGGVLNYAMNSQLQKQQFKEQEKLQERAFEMNQQAVQNQAANMAHGLENAGLNPADATGGLQAPTTQAGQASGANSQLAQIFSGISEMVEAIKAPTEIEKTAAETGLVGKQTDKIDDEVSKIRSEKQKLDADAINAQNLNEIYEKEKDFLTNHGSAIYDGYREQLKATKNWDKLPEKTRATIDAIAEGNTEIGIGELQGLQKIIDMQGNLSERDKQVLNNIKQMTIENAQMRDKKVMEAFEKMPESERNKLLQETKKIREEVKNLKESRKNMKSERLLMTKQGVKLESEARKIHTERELEELNDLNYLLNKERYDDAARLHALNSGRELWDLVKGTIQQGGKAAASAYVFKNFK